MIKTNNLKFENTAARYKKNLVILKKDLFEDSDQIKIRLIELTELETIHTIGVYLKLFSLKENQIFVYKKDYKFIKKYKLGKKNKKFKKENRKTSKEIILVDLFYK